MFGRKHTVHGLQLGNRLGGMLRRNSVRMHPYRRQSITSTQLTSTHVVHSDQHMDIIRKLARLDAMSVCIDLPQNDHDYVMSTTRQIVQHEEDKEYLSSFISNGCIEIMLRFLMYSKTLPASNSLSQDENGSLRLRTKYCAITILHTLLKADMTENRQRGKELAHDWEFLSYLVELCLLDDTSKAATILLSCLTRNHNCTLDLAKVENLLSNITAGQLTNFCRILSPPYRVVFSTQMQDSNQAILLKIPNFLERLVDMACDLSNPLQLTILEGLATCLYGKHQRQVCQVLVEAGFVNKFATMFMAHMKNPDGFVKYENYNFAPGMMGQLIISTALECLDRFCQGVPSKYLLLSKKEHQKVQKINSTLEEQYQDADCESVAMVNNEQQLILYIYYLVATGRTKLGEFSFLSKLLQILATFLRGGSHCLQMFLSIIGLLDCLITMISSEDDLEKIAFMYNVIAELVRFNPIVYKKLSHLLIRRQHFETFVANLKNAYILFHSRSLMEALILTSDIFCSDQEVNEDIQCNLTKHIQSYKIEYLKLLLQAISMSNYSVPSIETVMTILATANKRKQLPQYLKALADECSTDYCGCGVFVSFKDAFLKWQKDIELDKLIARADISMYDWHETVEALFEDDGQNDTSLQYWYLEDQRKFLSPAEETNEQRGTESTASDRCTVFNKTLSALLRANEIKK